MRSHRFFATPAGVFLALAAAATLSAQQALYVSDGESAMHLVRKIEDGVPYVVERGKLVPLTPAATGRSISYNFALKPAEEFYPAFVTIRNSKVSFPNFNPASLQRLDRRFSFTGALASDYPLKNVFLVFEFALADAPPGYQAVWVKGIASYELAESQPISQEVSFPDDTPRSTMKIHVFSDGLEVFHSEMPRADIEARFAKMAATRIAKVKDAAPKPIAGPMPHYPDALRKTRITGRAIVTCEIATNGQPTNLTVKSASNPAFGEAALAVMPQWWFLPKMENGHAVASKAELPFDFAPPKS